MWGTSAVSSEQAAQRRELAGLVRELTQSGRPELDEPLTRRVKQLCRLSDGLVDAVYDLALRQLGRRHAEVRLSALQLLDALFRRSHRLRQRAVADLQTIIDLCFETAGPLPPPRAAARRLTAAAAAALRHWHDKYAEGYKKLAVGYRFLQQARPDDLLPSQEQEAAARRVAEEEQLRLERLKQAKLEQLQREIQERRDEIVTTMTQVENCFTLLLPDVEMLACGEQEDGEDEDEEEDEEDEEAVEYDSIAEAEPSQAWAVLAREAPGPQLPDPGTASAVGNPDTSDLPVDPAGDPDVAGASAVTGVSSPRAIERPPSPEYDPDWAETGVLRSHGLPSLRHSVVVTVPVRPAPLAVTDDNAALVDTLRSLMSAVRRAQLPTVQRWIQVAETAGGGEGTLRQLRDVREALSSAVRRYDALQLSSTPGGGGDSSDDSDLEEVPDAEDPAALVARAAQTSSGRSGRSAVPLPTTSSGKSGAGSDTRTHSIPMTGESATSNSPAQKEEAVDSNNPQRSAADSDVADDVGDVTDGDTAARRARLLARAPLLGYSADLVTWGRGPAAAAGPAPPQYETARVWRSAAEAEAPPAEAADLRVVEFSGEFERVRHQCRAPLPSGRLCPRADRVKCPLHGVIVPRDEAGEALSEEVRRKERDARVRGDDWQDPKLLAELRATTGLDLRVRKGRRRQGGGSSNLTDLKRPASARQRLADKLFNARTVRRLSAALDRLDGRRHDDKFGDQFNYQVTGR